MPGNEKWKQITARQWQSNVAKSRGPSPKKKKHLLTVVSFDFGAI